MRKYAKKGHPKRRTRLFLSATVVLAFSTYINQVVGLQNDEAANQWPSMPRRNIAALAREGYLRSSVSDLKRSISTLAKNGQLPTFRSPYDETDKQEQDDEESADKRNLASIARLRSYSAMKRNIQALARDGHRFGRGQYSQQNEKRNIAALARNGMIHKRDEMAGDEYYYPFYQNPIPPLSDIDEPYDYNEMYDLQQSVNPDMLPPLSQVFKRNDVGNTYVPSQTNGGWNWNLKRGSVGLPALGLYRPMYIDPNNSNRNKRSVYSIPDVIDNNDIDEDNSEDYETDSDDKRSVDEDIEQQNFVKRHIGSLARYGLLPTFRYSGGRYSRSGRARLLLPSQEYLPPYRKYSSDENVQARFSAPVKNDPKLNREYISNPEDAAPVDAGDNSYVPPPAVPAHPHPTGRYLHRALGNDLPPSNSPPLPPPLTLSSYEPMTRNRWQAPKEQNKFYYFRSLKIPHHTSGKRYLLLPAVDNAIRKSYRNSSLPGRRKNL